MSRVVFEMHISSISRTDCCVNLAEQNLKGLKVYSYPIFSASLASKSKDLQKLKQGNISCSKNEVMYV